MFARIELPSGFPLCFNVSLSLTGDVRFSHPLRAANIGDPLLCVSSLFFSIALLILYVTFYMCYNLHHKRRGLQGEGFIKVSRFEAILKYPYVYFLVCENGLDRLLVETGEIFLNNLEGCYQILKRKVTTILI